ncbi:hypothetical protein H311_00370 [Anncaliia algerae PRA109]|nr:hypothetical protein H311_00370 [Anncaliia algerae PRA109]
MDILEEQIIKIKTKNVIKFCFERNILKNNSSCDSCNVYIEF